jgi:hypothetical protein
MLSETAPTLAQDLSFASASVRLSTMSSTRCRFVNWKISRREGPIPKKTTLPFWRSIRRLTVTDWKRGRDWKRDATSY